MATKVMRRKTRKYTKEEGSSPEQLESSLVTHEDREARARYFQSLLENTLDGILVLDSQGVPTYRHLPAAFENLHPDDLRRAIASVDRIARDPGARTYTEVRAQDKKGSWHYAEVVVTNHLDDPEVKGIILAFRDITDRKQAEEVQESRARYLQALIEKTSDGIVVIDSKGVACYRHLPTAFEDINPDDLKRAINSLDAIMSDPEARVLTEVRVKDKDGSWRYAEVTGTNYLQDPEVRGMILAFRDITERKWAEEKLEQAHKELVRTARDAGMAEVATSVLHNVGNVLNSVSFSASSIREKACSSRMDNLPKVAAMFEEHKDDLGVFLTADDRGRKLPSYISGLAQHLTDERDKLKDEAMRLSEQVDHIMEIINVQQSYGRATSFTELVAPAEIVEDALRINGAGLTRHGVEVKREFEELPAMIIDRHRILLILNNLITNAKNAMSEGGHPSKTLTLSLRKSDDKHLQYEVTDDGIGITEENMTRIFGHGFTTRKDGHGFGLHSAANAAKEMGGSLRCRSDGPGKGATFTLELPIVQEGEKK